MKTKMSAAKAIEKSNHEYAKVLKLEAQLKALDEKKTATISKLHAQKEKWFKAGNKANDLEKAENEALLDDFNYVGSRHHY